MKLTDPAIRQRILEQAKSLGRERLFLSADSTTLTDPDTGEQWRVRVRGEREPDLRALFVKPSDFRLRKVGNAAPRLNVAATDNGGTLSERGEEAREWIHARVEAAETIDEWLTRLARDSRAQRR